MSDYLSELRDDLLDAHERYAQRDRIGRATRLARPRVWRTQALAAVAIAGCVFALVVAVGALRAPAPHPGRLQVVATVQIGGIPADAAAGFGSLWVTDYRGAVLRVDPAGRRVQQSIPLGGAASSITVDRRGVWVMTEAGVLGTDAHLIRIDPRTGRIAARVPFETFDAALTTAGDAVWALASHDESTWLKRVDPATGRPVATARTDAGAVGVAVAGAGRSIWTLDNHGTITQREAGAGGVVRRLAGHGELRTGENGLVADARGAWVVSPARGAILRIEGGRVVRRIPVDPGTGAGHRPERRRIVGDRGRRAPRSLPPRAHRRGHRCFHGERRRRERAAEGDRAHVRRALGHRLLRDGPARRRRLNGPG